MPKNFCGFIFGLGSGGVCGEGAGCMVGGGPGFRCILFCLIRTEPKYFTQ